MEAEETGMAHMLGVPENKCELCDTNDIVWKCMDCDELICDFCKKVHLKSKMTRKHKVEQVGEADIRPSPHHDKLACSTHTDENIQMFCKPCSKPICRECIASETHLSHKLVKIEDVIQSAQNEISNIFAQAQIMINTREYSIEHMGKSQRENSRQMSVTVEGIKDHNTLIKQKLDKITNDFIEEIQNFDRKIKGKPGRTKRKLEEEVSMLKRLVDQCETKQNESPINLIQFVTDMKKELENLKSADLPDLLQSPEFVTKGVDEQDLTAVYGDLDFNSSPTQEIQNLPVQKTDPLPKPSFNLKLISNFASKRGDGVIAAVNDNQAWLCNVGDRTIKLLTSEGDEVRRITTDFSVHDIAVTKSGELLVTVNKGHVVKKLTTNGTSVDVWTGGDQGYKTSGIAVTDNDDIVVGLFFFTGDLKIGKYRYKVLRLSSSGQMLRIILQYYGREQIYNGFHNSCTVNSNMNGDILVGLRVEGCVIVIDKYGDKRFTYEGQVEGLRCKWSPCYIVTDKYGHILISDNNNSAVHLLDKHGTFLKLLVTGQHDLDIPHGMSIDTSGRLWIWNGNLWKSNGKVMVTKYL